jgi:DNA-directed RNA polymerase sigma subunit (sigma70/sigma32)
MMSMLSTEEELDGAVAGGLLPGLLPGWLTLRWLLGWALGRSCVVCLALAARAADDPRPFPRAFAPAEYHSHSAPRLLQRQAMAQEVRELVEPLLSRKELAVLLRISGVDGGPSTNTRVVAKELGTSHQNVSQLWCSALRKLKVALEGSPALQALMLALQES